MTYRSPPSLFSPSQLLAFATALLLALGCTTSTRAQSEDSFGDAAADPVKLFERGQNAHARGDLVKALEFYDEAIKVRPEFPEAEFQRGNLLMALGRLDEAEAGLRRAIDLRKNWSLPYSSLGAVLVRQNREADAEPVLREAIKLDAQDNLALRILAELRLRRGNPKEALQLAQRATLDKDSSVSAWLVRALAERATGDNLAAVVSLNRILEVDPASLSALIERAEIRIAAGEKELAIFDLKSAEPLIKKGDKANFFRLASAYEAAGQSAEAQRIGETAGLISQSSPSPKDKLKVKGTTEEIDAANSDDPEVARKALEILLAKNPDSAMLLARLGAAYRKLDANRSLDYYKRAASLEPANPDYATGYSSALVQARRFAEAATVLRRVIAAAPDNYAAHANLATALYELKQFAAALVEYEWLLKAKPDLAVAYYFIATAHDYLGEYKEALTAYENFLSSADPKTNQLEIEKIKLRLPSLRRQIQLGQGVKRKPERATKQ